MFSWGEPGTDPGCFNIVHNICCDREGWVYVADRGNHRIQVFDGDGRYESQWNNLHRPCGFYMEPRHNGAFYIGELGPFMALNRDLPNLGPRISILAHDGSLLARIGDNGPGPRADQFIAQHGLAMDSRGDIYVGEVSNTAWPLIYPEAPRPDGLIVVRKLVRLEGRPRPDSCRERRIRPWRLRSPRGQAPMGRFR